MSSYIKGGRAISAKSSTTFATGATALTHTDHRKSFTIMNMGVNAIYVYLSSSTPSATACHYVIPGGGTAADGTGGVLTVDQYHGVVTLAGTGLSYSVVEFV